MHHQTMEFLVRNCHNNDGWLSSFIDDALPDRIPGYACITSRNVFDNETKTFVTSIITTFFLDNVVKCFYINIYVKAI